MIAMCAAAALVGLSALRILKPGRVPALRLWSPQAENLVPGAAQSQWL